MTIGIIQVLLLQTTPVGSQIRQYMIHVQLVGVFQTVEAAVYGKLLDLRIHHTTVQIGEFPSVSVVHPLHGILLRVIAAAAVGRWTLSAATAPIGQLLLAAATRTAWSSSTVASARWAATIARAACQSVVSKNQNNLISVSICPSVARANGHAF